MALASITSWLALDRWSQIMGLDPLWFNQLYSATHPSNCGEPWFQYAWQNHNRMGREDIAEAIRDAERQISNYVGYNLLPDWVSAEVQHTTRGANPGLYSAGYNSYGVQKSITTKRNHFISGGQRAVTLIKAGARFCDNRTGMACAPVTPALPYVSLYVDNPYSVCELHVFYPGKNGDPAWEIRPVSIVDASPGVLITIPTYMLVANAQPSPYGAGYIDAVALDGDSAASYLTTVDVYRVYNDPQTQAELQWLEPNCGSCGGNGCSACEYGVQAGCLTAKDHRLGIVNYDPADWDSATSAFNASGYAVGRDPDRVKLWYYSGYRNEQLACPLATMDNELERAIAYFACALSTREFCECNNTEAFLNYWREDLARSDSARSFQNSSVVLDNPFGTQRGAVYAWRVCNQEGRRVQP